LAGRPGAPVPAAGTEDRWPVAAGDGAPVAASSHGGTLAGGAAWTAPVPDDWNGTLVLYSHGFRQGPANPARDEGFDAAAYALLATGYAIASSSYAGLGWALGTAVRDQLDTLAAFSAAAGKPERTIAYGVSMGGLVSSRLAEIPDAGIDGAVSTCGVLGGGLNLANLQLDGTYAAAALLLPGENVQLAGFSSAGQAGKTADRLRAAVQQAQQSAQGRARIALVAALLNLPAWHPDSSRPEPADYAAQQEARYRWLVEILPLVMASRAELAKAAGGDSAWNEGVDYGAIFEESGQRAEVEHLYRQADLHLAADLAALTAGADTAPDPGAVDWMSRTSTLTGRLQVPVLTMHTVADMISPVEQQELYAGSVRRAGAGQYLRQLYVERAGHCAFSTSERVAAVAAMGQSLELGRWTGSTDSAAINGFAESLGLGQARFTGYRPDPFINDRTAPAPARQ
ncbi:alpha/beta hydrolase, partial [Arthrobacter deserti]|nr:alpha/beta hydrolase [Arthrobacter deserti]